MKYVGYSVSVWKQIKSHWNQTSGSWFNILLLTYLWTVLDFMFSQSGLTLCRLTVSYWSVRTACCLSSVWKLKEIFSSSLFVPTKPTRLHSIITNRLQHEHSRENVKSSSNSSSSSNFIFHKSLQDVEIVIGNNQRENNKKSMINILK